MEWIKAESGMPKNVSNHIFRQISSKTVLSASMVNDWVEDGYLQDLEWLDESASPEAVDAVKFAEWIDGQGYECTLHTDDNIKLWEKYPDVQSTANRRARLESFTTAELYQLFKQSKQ